jgi:hypothetical protein
MESLNSFRWGMLWWGFRSIAATSSSTEVDVQMVDEPPSIARADGHLTIGGELVDSLVCTGLEQLLYPSGERESMRSAAIRAFAYETLREDFKHITARDLLELLRA